MECVLDASPETFGSYFEHLKQMQTYLDALPSAGTLLRNKTTKLEPYYGFEIDRTQQLFAQRHELGHFPFLPVHPDADVFEGGKSSIDGYLCNQAPASRGLVVYYERVQEDYQREVMRIADFLQIPLSTVKFDSICREVDWGNKHRESWRLQLGDEFQKRLAAIMQSEMQDVAIAQPLLKWMSLGVSKLEANHTAALMDTSMWGTEGMGVIERLKTSLESAIGAHESWQGVLSASSDSAYGQTHEDFDRITAELTDLLRQAEQDRQSLVQLCWHASQLQGRLKTSPMSRGTRMPGYDRPQAGLAFVAIEQDAPMHHSLGGMSVPGSAHNTALQEQRDFADQAAERLKQIHNEILAPSVQNRLDRARRAKRMESSQSWIMRP